MKTQTRNYLIPKKDAGLMMSTGQQGFTLIETLVGVTILLVAVVGPLFIAFQGVKLSYFARDQVIASYLAQEGIELVRLNIIANDNAGEVGKELISSGTGYDLSACSTFVSGATAYCTIDAFAIPATAITGCLGGDCPYIKYDAINEKYQYSSGDDTLFKRSIRVRHAGVDGANGDKEFQIESKVEWSHQGDNKEVILKEVFMDWRPN